MKPNYRRPHRPSYALIAPRPDNVPDWAVNENEDDESYYSDEDESEGEEKEEEEEESSSEKRGTKNKNSEDSEKTWRRKARRGKRLASDVIEKRQRKRRG